jgi:transposase
MPLTPNPKAQSKSKSKSLSPSVRRRRLTALRRDGHTMAEIAEHLGCLVETVWRDLKALRHAAARRDPWAAPEDGPPAFIEEAEDVLQKVRRAQLEAAKKDSGAYVSLLKAEWDMLMQLIKMTRDWANHESEDPNHDDELATLSNQDLLDSAKGLGLDVRTFEAALRGRRAEADPPTHDAGRREDDEDETRPSAETETSTGEAA